MSWSVEACPHLLSARSLWRAHLGAAWHCPLHSRCRNNHWTAVGATSSYTVAGGVAVGRMDFRYFSLSRPLEECGLVPDGIKPSREMDLLELPHAVSSKIGLFPWLVLQLLPISHIVALRLCWRNVVAEMSVISLVQVQTLAGPREAGRYGARGG